LSIRKTTVKSLIRQYNQGEVTRARVVRELAKCGLDLAGIRAALGLAAKDLRASEVRSHLANGTRPVGRPRKRTLRTGCEELVREWSELGSIGLSAKVAARQLQKLLDESSGA
jgi:hypothetical protein